jgi:hypothetical protein
LDIIFEVSKKKIKEKKYHKKILTYLKRKEIKKERKKERKKGIFPSTPKRNLSNPQNNQPFQTEKKIKK